jgi:hypothetical protein
MQIGILNGIYTDGASDIRTSLPVNLVPVPKDSGISKGYLRPADGITQFATGVGLDRGAINWSGTMYRVQGTKLISVAQDGTVVVCGDVGGSDLVTLDYSFDVLAIGSNGNLYYWDGTALTQNTDPDLGVVVDVLWIDGYFVTTDGANLVVTELDNIYAVNPLKYGSSEIDPDPVVGVMKVRNELQAINRYTIEAFNNVGGDYFPFQRIDGAQVQKGALSRHTCCLFVDAIAFMGSGFNEATAIYVGANGTATKISTSEIDQILLTFTESQLAESMLESRVDRAHQHLFVHLPDRTLVYDASASVALGEPVWFVLSTSMDEYEQYRARSLVWAYNRWNVGDPQSSAIGYLDHEHGAHWGETVYWLFGTQILYNESRGALFHELELVTLTGRMAVGTAPRVATSYSLDGETWSIERDIAAGTSGGRTKRLVWFRNGSMNSMRIQRFRGDSTARMSFARLEARLEPLF